MFILNFTVLSIWFLLKLGCSEYLQIIHSPPQFYQNSSWNALDLIMAILIKLFINRGNKLKLVYLFHGRKSSQA